MKKYKSGPEKIRKPLKTSKLIPEKLQKLRKLSTPKKLKNYEKSREIEYFCNTNNTMLFDHKTIADIQN